MDLEKINQAKIDVLENCVLWTVDKDANFGFDLNRYEEQQSLLLEYITSLENNQKELRRMIEKTIIALNENAKDPTDEFITTSVGTFGRVLNMMDELEGKDE